MTKVRIRAYRKEDAAQLPNTEYLYQLEMNGPTFTGVADGHIVFVCGIQRIMTGSGEAWLSPGYRFFEYPGCALAIRGLLRETFESGDWHRLQAHCCAEVPAYRSFLEWLGFSYGATLEQFGENREDYYLMAIVEGT